MEPHFEDGGIEPAFLVFDPRDRDLAAGVGENGLDGRIGEEEGFQPAGGGLGLFQRGAARQLEAHPELALIHLREHPAVECQTEPDSKREQQERPSEYPPPVPQRPEERPLVLHCEAGKGALEAIEHRSEEPPSPALRATSPPRGGRGTGS